jgi:hypothetical protein
MTKKKSKTSVLDEILSKAIFYKWCTVNTENEFNYGVPDWTYVIDESVKQYMVFNKPKVKNGVLNDWTNAALMTRILYVDVVSEVKFFDENFVDITDKVKIKTK